MPAFQMACALYERGHFFMNLVKINKNLPATIKELTKFVLIGREKLTAVRAHIRAIDKLGLAKEVREQKQGEAQMLAGALLDAEAKLGEILRDIPLKGKTTGLGGRTSTLPYGITKFQSSQFQTLAANWDIIEQVKAEAEENEDLPTRTEVLKRVKEKEREESKSKVKPALPLPEGKYNVIVIDPPWPYGTDYNPESRRVATPYEEMSIEKIKELKLPSADDCVLWLWTTHQFIWDAKYLLEHCGFEYKLILVWDKEKIGMGSWLRCQVEFCLLGIKGRPQWNLTNERDLIRESRREHSRKPDAFYEMIRILCAGRRLDMFNRETHDGFDSWGNEKKF